MPTPAILKAPFVPDNFYHIVCKSVDGILLFNEPVDTAVYANKFRKFTNRFFDTWSYSLLDNHTHHIARMKSAKSIAAEFHNIPKTHMTLSSIAFTQDPGNNILFDCMIERQMNNFLVSYAHYYNLKYNRQGGTFQKPFKRVLISDESHLQHAIIYTHANAQKHGLVKDFTLHPYNSYEQILAGDNSYVASEAVLEFFGGKARFEKLHKDHVDYYYGFSALTSKLE